MIFKNKTQKRYINTPAVETLLILYLTQYTNSYYYTLKNGKCYKIWKTVQVI